MKKVAVLLDGGFVQKRLKELLNLERNPESDVIYDFATNLIKGNKEEIFRIFFYHGGPYKRSQARPISLEKFDFANNPLAGYTEKLFKELGKKDYIALRIGETAFRGWKLKNRTVEKIKKESDYTLTDYDFEAELDQKGVDIRIGLDVAWLASKHIVDRIILVSGDTDFIPAMKFARKEGIQVVMCKIGPKNIKDELLVHSDLVREVNYVDGKWTFVN